MARWIALLRAVNLGSRNKVSMPRLREVLTEAGYEDVRTLIASGNVLLNAPRKPPSATLEALIADEFGVTTAVILRSAAEIRSLAAAKPFPRDAHVAFLARKPRTTAPLEGLDPFVLVGRDIVVHAPRGYANVQLSGAVIEKALGIAATVRNWNTVEKLAALTARS
jgi:uncharacterized protein (DUF1697 family)